MCCAAVTQSPAPVGDHTLNNLWSQFNPSELCCYCVAMLNFQLNVTKYLKHVNIFIRNQASLLLLFSEFFFLGDTGTVILSF